MEQMGWFQIEKGVHQGCILSPYLFNLYAECCCCCCWVTSVVSNSVWIQRRQPTRLTRPWNSPGKNTGVGCHFLLQFMKVKSESETTQSCLTLSDPMDCSLPGTSVHGLPLPSPYMQSTSWKIPGLMKRKLETRLLGEITITSDMQITPILWQKVKRN